MALVAVTEQGSAGIYCNAKAGDDIQMTSDTPHRIIVIDLGAK